MVAEGSGGVEQQTQLFLAVELVGFGCCVTSE